MPNIHAAEKRVRADAKRRLRNLGVDSELKTLTRRFRSLVKEGQREPAQTLYRTLARRLDQAARRGVIHRNTASRRKSSFARQLV